MVRKCDECGSEYGLHVSQANSLFCPSCQTARNRKVRGLQKRKRLQKLSAERSAYKEGKPCLDCGGSFPHYVLDFDHRPGEEKKYNVGSVHTRSALQAEIAKCDLVCSNCHRIRHHNRT